MLLHLINIKDTDTLKAFSEYHQSNDSEFLISFIQAKTEDALQYLLFNNFSNEETS
jgi:hypothetical protein